MNTKPIECPACGAVALSPCTGPGRAAWHRNMLVAVPADFPLPDCSACDARPLNARTVAEVEPHLEAAWRAQTQASARADIDTLAKAKPLYAWERLLNLSPGSLSKLPDTEQPSGPFVALLRLLANDVSRAAELDALWAGDAPR